MANTPVSNKTCYLPDGSVSGSNAPCYSTTTDGYSHCCDPTNDVCLDNGLCYSSWHGVLYRRSCTDSSWESSNCPQYCTKTYMNVGVGVFAKSQFGSNTDQLSCCIGWNTTTNKCLDNRVAVDVRSGRVLENFGTLTASQVTATGTATGTATATSGSLVASCEKAPQHDVAIGVGVGVPLGLIVLALVGLLMREKRQRKSEMVRNGTHGVDEAEKTDSTVAPQVQYVPTEAPGYAPNEAHGRAINEAYGEERRAEME